MLSIDNDPMIIIGERVNEALWPWRAGQASTFRNYMIDTMEEELVLEIELLPGLPFTHTIDMRKLVDDPEEYAWKVAEAAFVFYRYRPTLPVDDHIVLGEN